MFAVCKDQFRKLQLHHFYVKDCISDMKYEICDVYLQGGDIQPHSGYNVSLELWGTIKILHAHVQNGVHLHAYDNLGYKTGYIYTRMYNVHVKACLTALYSESIRSRHRACVNVKQGGNRP